MSALKREHGRDTSVSPEYDAEAQAEIHALLGDERRLEVLDILACVGWIKQRPLAAEVASREQGRDIDPNPNSKRTDDREAVGDVLLDLYSEHLPEMEEAGAVAYKDITIAQGPRFSDFVSARDAVALSQGVPISGELLGGESDGE